MAKDENEAAKTLLDAEKAKFGFKRPAALAANEDSDSGEEEDQDMGNLDEDNKGSEKSESKEEEAEEESDDSEEDDSDEEDSDEDEEEDESEDDEDNEKSQKKGKVSFQTYNKTRSALREANKKLTEALENNKALEAKLPDDFQARMDALAKEIGVSDPENLKKIVNLIKEVAVDKNVKGLEQKISDLEKKVAEQTKTTVVDEFPNEWVSFEKDFFKQEFPNATDEQLKTARETMRRLAGTKNVGGKSYIHKETGQEVLDPYPLDYIFYKNKDIFSEMVTGKKRKGMESTRSFGAKREDEGGEEKHLNKNSSASDIRALDKKYSKLEAGESSMRAPADSTI